MTSILEAQHLEVGYGHLRVGWDINLEVQPGKVLALLGPNGAGKSTTVRTLVGSLPRLGGEILWKGKVTKAPLHRRAADGLGFVPDGRSVFSRLSTIQNLRLGGVEAAVAVTLFPELQPLLERRGGLLSGGQQQILSVARALLRKPKALLVDELSFGLAPQVVSRLLGEIRRIATESGMGVLIVEQHIRQALEIADEVHVMRQGRIVLTGSGADMKTRVGEIESMYMASDSPPTDPTRRLRWDGVGQ